MIWLELITGWLSDGTKERDRLSQQHAGLHHLTFTFSPVYCLYLCYYKHVAGRRVQLHTGRLEEPLKLLLSH